MKTICLVVLALFIRGSVIADKSVICYSAGASGTIPRGCASISFATDGFTGTLGNATVSSGISVIFSFIPVWNRENLSALSYTKTGGSMYVCEVR